MAFSLNWNRPFCRCLRILTTNSISIHNKVLSVESDSLDEFTSQLMQRKVDKWSGQKPIQKITRCETLAEHNVTKDFTYLSDEKLNSHFQLAIDVNDNKTILNLMKQCIKAKRCPSFSNILYSLSICSQNGDKTTIDDIKQLCERLCPEVLETNSNFQHYIAEAVWMKGNINESLRLFENVYKDNAYLRRRIRLMLKYLIAHTISNRSEATLLNIIKFSEELKRTHGDFFPLMCVWQACFLSEWFSDQCIAFDLLNKHNGLHIAVISRISYVVAVSLNSHRTEVVYRLLEVLLHFEMKSQYGDVLIALLDYQIGRGDIRSCIEIVQWSLQNDVELPSVQNEGFLNLLLQSKDGMTNKLATTKNMEKRTTTNFKF